MKRFIEGVDREQSTLLPECLEDWIEEDNPGRVAEVVVHGPDLGALGLDRVQPQATGSVAIDGAKFKAVNNRDRHFTAAKMKRRMA